LSSSSNNTHNILIAMQDGQCRSEIEKIAEELFHKIYFAADAFKAIHLLDSDLEIKFIICDGDIPNLAESDLELRIMDERKKRDLLFLITTHVDRNVILFSPQAEAESDGCLVLPLQSLVIKRLLKRVLIRVEKSAALNSYLAQLKQQTVELENINQLKTKNIVELQKNAIIGEMISGFIHNLKTPLMIASTSLEILKMQIEKISPDSVIDQNVYNSMQQHITNTISANQRMNGLLDLLMTKKRDDNNQNCKPVDLNDIVRKEMAFLESDLEFKHKYKKIISLTQSYNTILVVYGEVAQILYNIINNAKEAMWQRDIKTIIIATQADREYASLIIEDTGCGIAEENLNKIFEPFFTTKPAKDEVVGNEPSGTGLGLHSVKNLIAANKGDITAESCLGEWTRFTIRFPLYKDDSRKSDELRDS